MAEPSKAAERYSIWRETDRPSAQPGLRAADTASSGAHSASTMPRAAQMSSLTVRNSKASLYR